MSGSDAGEVEFSLKVMMNEKKTKVLFAEAGSDFVDILLSFLTLPLGRIVKVLEKKYGDEAPAIGSLSTLYHSLRSLDSSHFWTEGAKETLLDPISIFDAECERLKLDIVDSPPVEYFCCPKDSDKIFRSVSMFYNTAGNCPFCYPFLHMMTKAVVVKRSKAASGDGVFTMRRASFIISDDLQIFPRETRFLQMISTLGITDRDNHETIKVDFGSSEIMYLLKASLTSPTPLSDLILNKTVRLNSAVVEPQLMTAEEYNPSCNSLTLNVIIQRSTGKLLYAQAKKDFIEFLLSLLSIPLGEVEHLLGGTTCLKAINNLYRSTADVIDEYFKSPDAKTRLMKPNVAHGCISENHILPLTEEPLPATYKYFKNSSSSKFPKGQGSYLQGLQTYMVSDDLTVVPYCFTSMLASLREQKIAISDVEDVVLQIGLKEGLSILRASLASTRALTDALLTQISNKQVKREVLI